MTRVIRRVSLGLLITFIFAFYANAQTATYHLHKEASSTSGLFQLKTAGPDGTTLAVQSANLKNLAVGEYLIKAFDTQSGVPNASGVVPAGSTITFTLWMNKTSTSGVMFPRAKLRLNNITGTLFCTATGSTALTTTLTKYTFSATTSSSISMTTTDRLYVWVGVNITTVATSNTNANLNIEGTLNGNYDSLTIVPTPLAAPAISGLSTTSGPVGTSVTVTGSNFGASQGTSTVTFNGTAATPSSWSATSISVPVPPAATTGSVIVTVGGSSSNGVAFTVITTGTVSGRITALDGTTPIQGATVNVVQGATTVGTATTNSTGDYALTSLNAGTYSIVASAAGYGTKSQSPVTVVAGGTTAVNLSLEVIFSGPVSYVYDALGRLVSAIGPTDTAVYTYDAVGNLLSISRQSSNQVSIIQFSPSSGQVGTSVIISGTGFSATTNQNTVTFNGVAATVASSSPTEIVTAVPAGATTGPLAITTPTGSATSSTPFSVTASTAPTIASFTPTIGPPGTTLTISGTNFDTTVSNDWVTFNNRYALVNSATSIAISTDVPQLSTSGRISVATPAGKATSVADFFVPPAPFAATDIEVTGRMNFGESKTVAISTANKIGLILFDGTALQRASLKVNSFSMTSCVVVIYNPDGTALAATTFYANGGVLDTPLLPATGTYTILIDPPSTNTGSIDFTLYNATDVTGTITPGGAAVTVTTTTPGQNARLSFLATAGQRVSLQFSDSTFGGCYAVYDVIKSPDGATLASSGFCTATGFVDTVTLPVAGYYTLLVDPQVATTGSQTLLLNDVPPDVTGPITPGGPAVTITTTTPGQNAILTFSGTVGQRVSLQLSNSTFAGCYAAYNTIKRPDGTTLTSIGLCGATGFLDTVALPVTGTYTILIDPQETTFGTETLLLNDVPADVTASITPGGAAVTITTPTPGQNAVLTFNGTAGQRVSLQLSNSTFTGCYAVYNTIKKPDGTTLTSIALCGATGFLDTAALPVTGTYTILIDPQGTTFGSETLLLNDVPADVTASITPGGAAVTLTTTTPGQNGQATFAATANQRVTLNITGVTLTGGSYNWVTVSIKNPDGSTLTSGVYDSSGGFIGVQTLATAGTYTILIDPWDTTTGSVTLTLNDVP
jgi:YD repeat-containing protein